MAVTSVRAGGDFQTIEGVQSAIHEKALISRKFPAEGWR